MASVNKPYCIDLYQEDDVTGSEDEGFLKVKASGILFLDHKASEGSAETDRMAAFRIPRWLDGPSAVVTDVDGTSFLQAPRAGLYHFNGEDTAVNEAAHFKSVVQPFWQPGIDLCLDWEQTKAHHLSRPASWAQEFCMRIENWCGFPVKIYGGNVPREQLENVSDALIEYFAGRRLWFCEYGPFNPGMVPKPWRGNPLGVFQWQDDGDQYGPGAHRIPGINENGGYCDNSTVVQGMTVKLLNAGWAAVAKNDFRDIGE